VTIPFAPISLFVYNRPEHTKKTLSSLMSNPEFSKSQVYVYCDGPKHNKDIQPVLAVREVIRSLSLPNIVMIEQEENLGLANSIIGGVTDLCDKYGRVIVVEDDLKVSPFFLDYMIKALNRYESEEKVMQISGYMFPVKLIAETDAIFLPFTTSWGWATWQRAWKNFDPDIAGYIKLKSSKKLRRKFDLNGSYPYFKLLNMQKKGKINSWAICYYLSVFLQNGLTLHPVQSLVQNMGFDGSGTHCKSRINIEGVFRLARITKMPDVNIDLCCFDQIVKYLKKKRSYINFLIDRVLSKHCF
jgi:GT2 family glycosyltransferase